MAFEKFVPPQAAGTRPRATIRPSGLISFDAASVAAFGLESAKFAILFFDQAFADAIVSVRSTFVFMSYGEFYNNRSLALVVVGIHFRQRDQSDAQVIAFRMSDAPEIPSPRFCHIAH